MNGTEGGTCVMNETLDRLIDLQKLDTELGALRKEKETLEHALETRRAAVTSVTGGITGVQEKITGLKKAADQKNLELKSIEEKVKDLTAKLNAASDNKTYSLLKGEIEEEQRKISALEENILADLDNVDLAGDDIEALREKLVAEEKVLAAAEKDALQQAAVLDSKIATLATQRKDLAAHVDGETMETYEGVLAHRGDAVVELRGGNCSGCNMKLTKQQQALIIQSAQIVTCPGCGSILYTLAKDIVH